MFGGAVTAVALARAEKRRLCNATMAATERHGQRSRQTERPEDLASLQPGVAGMVSGSPGALLGSKRVRISAGSTSMGPGGAGRRPGGKKGVKDNGCEHEHGPWRVGKQKRTGNSSATPCTWQRARPVPLRRPAAGAGAHS